MAACSLCGSETELYSGGIPLCLKCLAAYEAGSIPSDAEIHRRLQNDEAMARVESKVAYTRYCEIVKDIPSGLPAPDGSERIHRTQRDLECARQRHEKAHERLMNFLVHGVVPDDLG